MKIVVLGGSGVIGSYAVKYLSNMDIFSRVLIADSNEKKAKELSKISNKIDFKKIDATDMKKV